MTPPSNKPIARTFNMTVKDAIVDNDVIAGMLLVNSEDACVLIDFGATRSFISLNFMSKLGIESTTLEEVMVIEVANQEVVNVDQLCLNCDIEIRGQHFTVDLIPFKLGEFDVILEMDWLVKYDAQINCRRKRVSVKKPEGKQVMLYEQKQRKKFLSMMEAKRLLRQ
ncbi:uncharacterized protein LOC141691713 [Apium graveolens]|uniref:uncharacterized protein LOC141691713 n=1 Tax=Apium graveolens TaxID=4045 RepID=UPI003D7AD224